MKKPTEEQMKTLLQAACILTKIQDETHSVQLAYLMWNYLDQITEKYPELTVVYFRQKTL